MKKEYQRPEIVEEVVELEDVIAASNGGATSIAGSIKKTLSDLFKL